MPRPFLRSISLLLTACLIVEQAAGIDFQPPLRPIAQASATRSLLNQQALFLREAAGWTLARPPAVALRQMATVRIPVPAPTSVWLLPLGLSLLVLTNTGVTGDPSGIFLVWAVLTAAAFFPKGAAVESGSRPAASPPDQYVLDATFNPLQSSLIYFVRHRIKAPKYMVPGLVARWWRIEDGRPIYGHPSDRKEKAPFDHLEIAMPEHPTIRLEIALHPGEGAGVHALKFTLRDLATGGQEEEIVACPGHDVKEVPFFTLHLLGIGRRFLDASIGIPSEPGHARALAIRNWLLTLDRQKKAIHREGRFDTGMWGVSLRTPHDVRSGRMLVTILSETERYRRFVLFLDAADHSHFFVFAISHTGQISDASTGEIVAPVRLSQRGLSPIEFPSLRRFFREVSRKLSAHPKPESSTGLTLQQRPQSGSAPHALGFPKGLPLVIIKGDQVTAKTAMAGGNAGSRIAPTNSPEPDEETAFPIFLSNPAILDPEPLPPKIKRFLAAGDPRFFTSPGLREEVSFLGRPEGDRYVSSKRLAGSLEGNDGNLSVFRRFTWDEEPRIYLQTQMAGGDHFTIEGVDWTVGPQRGRKVLFQTRINLRLLFRKYGNGRLISIPARFKVFDVEDEELSLTGTVRPPVLVKEGAGFVIRQGAARSPSRLESLTLDAEAERAVLVNAAALVEIPGVVYVRGGRPGLSISSEEPVALADPVTGKPLREALSRQEVHERGLPHQTVHVYLEDPEDRLILQRRSLALATSPGKLQVSISGHVDGADLAKARSLDDLEWVRQVGMREGDEEMGIRLDPKRLVPLSVINEIKRREPNNFEYTTVLYCRLTAEEAEDLQKTFNTNEVAELALVPTRALRSLVVQYPEAFSGSIRHMVENEPAVLGRLLHASESSKPTRLPPTVLGAVVLLLLPHTLVPVQFLAPLIVFQASTAIALFGFLAVKLFAVLRSISLARSGLPSFRLLARHA